MHAVAKVVLLGSVVLLVLTHLAIVTRLALRTKPRRRALFAILLPPLAPWLAHRQHWRRLSYAWFTALIGYALALLVLLHS